MGPAHANLKRNKPNIVNFKTEYKGRNYPGQRELEFSESVQFPQLSTMFHVLECFLVDKIASGLKFKYTANMLPSSGNV